MTIGTDNLFVELTHQWYFGDYNWYTFTPIEIRFEWDRYIGGVWCDFTLLNFTLYARWNYDPSKIEELKKEADEDIAKGVIEDYKDTFTALKEYDDK